MHIDLTDQTAIVTGSTAGIGLAIAKGLAAAGAHVVVNGRTEERVREAVEAVGEMATASVSGAAIDLSTAAGCEALVREYPRCDVLVNNLGIYGMEDFYETTDQTWSRFFETNVMSGVRLARAYTPSMVEAGFGRVVFISSESALNIPEDMIHYGFTKTAQVSIARGLAKRLRGTGVTVNSVLPGPTLSEGLEELLADQAEADGVSIEEAGIAFVKANRGSSILQRPATVEEVANMVVYACSPLASATTGAALRVDGGVVDTIA